MPVMFTPGSPVWHRPGRGQSLTKYQLCEQEEEKRRKRRRKRLKRRDKTWDSVLFYLGHRVSIEQPWHWGQSMLSWNNWTLIRVSTPIFSLTLGNFISCLELHLFFQLLKEDNTRKS